MSTRFVHAASLTAPRTIEVLRKPRPELSRGEVRVRILASGICASDVRLWEGRTIRPAPYPLQLGHEFAGEVVELGPGVTGSVGAQVAVCAPSYELLGSDRRGMRGMATDVVASAGSCFPVADHVRFPFVAEPLGRVASTVNAAKADSRSHTVIVGGSFKALLALMWIVTYWSPRRVYLVSTRLEVLQLADRLGAHAVPPESLAAVVKKATRRRGADIAYDFTGTQAGLHLAAESVGHGGKLVIGSARVEAHRGIDHAYLQSHSIAGIEADRPDEQQRRHAMELGTVILNRRQLALDPLPVQQYPGEKIDAAFEEAARGAAKVFVTP